MMVVWRVRQVAEARGITNPYQLAQRTGVANGTARGLWYGTVQAVSLPTLTKVCRQLGVQVSELFMQLPGE
jgi:DNA-binding Xre family transcriptional regulator